jgi:hypothetical protein
LVLRIALAVFVLAWLFGPAVLRSAVPVWLPFVIALGLELQFLLVGWRSTGNARPDRLPQRSDRERYGYGGGAGELLLVRDREGDLFIPYSGETGADVDALVARAREEAEAASESPTVLEPAPRRPLRQFLIGVCVLGVLAAVVWVADRQAGWDGLDADTRAAAASRFSAEASRVVRRPVVIRCDESGDYVGAVQHADGVAAVGGRLAYLAPERCYDLYRLAFRGDVTFSQTARSLAVLAHEAWHLRGVRDEGATECYALQSGVDMGRRLGLSEETARRMMRQQLAENALRGGASVEYLVPAECRNGGSLDLKPGDDDFP